MHTHTERERERQSERDKREREREAERERERWIRRAQNTITIRSAAKKSVCDLQEQSKGGGGVEQTDQQ